MGFLVSFKFSHSNFSQRQFLFIFSSFLKVRGKLKATKNFSINIHHHHCIIQMRKFCNLIPKRSLKKLNLKGTSLKSEKGMTALKTSFLDFLKKCLDFYEKFVEFKFLTFSSFKRSSFL